MSKTLSDKLATVLKLDPTDLWQEFSGVARTRFWKELGDFFQERRDIIYTSAINAELDGPGSILEREKMFGKVQEIDNILELLWNEKNNIKSR